MSGICAKIHAGLFNLDTMLSGSHPGRFVCNDDHCHSHPRHCQPRPITVANIEERCWDALKVVVYNPIAFIGNTLFSVCCLIIAIITSYRLLSASSRHRNIKVWMECGLRIKYMAQNVYYIVKHAALGLTILTFAVELYKYCRPITKKG